MYSLLKHNTFGIDARCEDFISYRSSAELINLLPSLKGRRLMPIGSGSNLVFVGDFHGVILHNEDKTIEVVGQNDNGVRVSVSAGCVWDDLVAFSVENGYYGLENLSLIPGEVGASAVQNIGAYGVEACDYIREVETIEIESGTKKTFDVGELSYGYRTSAFKKELKGKHIITRVTYELKRRFIPQLNYGGLRRELAARGIKEADLTAESLRAVIIDIRRAKLPDPSIIGSAGSFFMNPVVSMEKANELSEIYPEMPRYNVEGGVKIPAGWMIEQCGWKGRSLGRAGVYEKQALVLVNRGGATGHEVLTLCERVRKDVFDRFAIEIQPEAIIIKR